VSFGMVCACLHRLNSPKSPKNSQRPVQIVDRGCCVKVGPVLIALFILPLSVQAKNKNYPVTWNPASVEQTLGHEGGI